MASLYVVSSILFMFIVAVHCQRNPRIRGIDPIDTLGLGASSFDLSQVHDITQPVSDTETLLQRRQRLAAEVAALDQALGPSDTGVGGAGRRRNRQRSGRRRNRQRNRDILIDPLVGSPTDRRNRQRDAGILVDPGHDHSHVDSPSGRGLLIDPGHDHAPLDPFDRLGGQNRRRGRGRNGLSEPGVGGRRSAHGGNFDEFLDRVLGPVGPGERIQGQGRRGRTIDPHGHLDTHDHATDIRPSRGRGRRRQRENVAGHAGHDHGRQGHQGGRFDAFLDNVLGPDPVVDKPNKKVKGQNKKGKGKGKGKKNTSATVHTDHHEHTPKTETRNERQNRQQNGIRGFLQNLLLGELSRRLTGPQLTGPRFGPQPFNPFVPRRAPPMFILG